VPDYYYGNGKSVVIDSVDYAVVSDANTQEGGRSNRLRSDWTGIEGKCVDAASDSLLNFTGELGKNADRLG
jgi:hypothetical protein